MITSLSTLLLLEVAMSQPFNLIPLMSIVYLQYLMKRRKAIPHLYSHNFFLLIITYVLTQSLLLSSSTFVISKYIILLLLPTGLAPAVFSTAYTTSSLSRLAAITKVYCYFCDIILLITDLLQLQFIGYISSIIKHICTIEKVLLQQIYR